MAYKSEALIKRSRFKKLNKNLRIKYSVNGNQKRHKSRKVYNTAGRVPAIDTLNLDKANIAFDESGVLVNDFLQSKTNKRQGQGAQNCGVGFSEGRSLPAATTT